MLHTFVNGILSCRITHGKKVANTIPTFQTQLNPQWPDLEHLQKREASKKQLHQEHFNISHQVKKLAPLAPGTEVQITTDDKQGVVLKETGSPRQHAVQTPTTIIRRNRRHLVPLSHETPEPSPVTYSILVPAGTPSRHIAEKPPDSPQMNVLSRPKRLITPSLKALENMELNG